MHTLPTGATPVLKGGNGQRKLEVGISIMEVWRMKTQSIMFGVELVLNFFLNDRMGSLDGDLWSKIGLTTEQMVLGDALFSINCCFQFEIRRVQVSPGIPGSHSSVRSNNSQIRTHTQSDSDDCMGTSSSRLKFMSWLILTELS